MMWGYGEIGKNKFEEKRRDLSASWAGGRG
jgi:hypothetical protein